MKPYKHCQISVKNWGGKPDDYLKIHNWFDARISRVNNKAFNELTKSYIAVENEG